MPRQPRFDAPGPFLRIRGIFEYNNIDTKDLIVPVGIASLVYWILTTRFAANLSRFGLVLYLLFYISYGFVVAKHVNCWFDSGNGTIYATRVACKEIKRMRRFQVPTLKLQPWGPRKEVNELDVPRGVYKQVGVGDRGKIDTGPGFLRVPWVRRVGRKDAEPETVVGDLL